MVINRIPISWKIILGNVQKVSPNAIIAGGALRDLDNGRPISDLDIFIPVAGVDEFHVVSTAVTPLLGCEPDGVAKTGYKGTTQAHYVCSNRFRTDDIEVNLVGVLCMDVLERFDFGLCKISYDGRELVKLPGYMDDVANHTITYDSGNPYVFRATSMKRVAKIQGKYPGWAYNEVTSKYHAEVAALNVFAEEDAKYHDEFAALNVFAEEAVAKAEGLEER
jgi:hypothetical protein